MPAIESSSPTLPGLLWSNRRRFAVVVENGTFAELTERQGYFDRMPAAQVAPAAVSPDNLHDTEVRAAG
jgi:hypothetical protein